MPKLRVRTKSSLVLSPYQLRILIEGLDSYVDNYKIELCAAEEEELSNLRAYLLKTLQEFPNKEGEK